MENWECHKITEGGLVKCTHPESRRAVFLGKTYGSPSIEIAEGVAPPEDAEIPILIVEKQEIAVIDVYAGDVIPGEGGDWETVGTQAEFGKQVLLRH